jgi:hypothetical protein
LLAALALACATCVHVSQALAQRLPDEPAATTAARARPAGAPAEYADALKQWTTPEDVASYVGATFVYDRARALALAEGVVAGSRPAIHAPAALYAQPQGVCVDLARFGVETLNRLDPRYAARYLMVEFEPVVVQGRTLRRHWVALFERDGRVFAFADSYRPGHVAGPYASVADYVAAYERLRERRIVGWQERTGFERRLRATRVERS